VRILARERALDILGDENCIKVLGDLYLCGLDYLLVKRFVLSEIAGDVFGFVGNGVPILGIECEKYLMYYGVPDVLYDARFGIEGWRRAESHNSVIVYNCIDDTMEFFEIEMFIFSRVPLNMFGFGSAELYDHLIGLLRRKSLYMLRYFY
jgi:hypothetical protein